MEGEKMKNSKQQSNMIDDLIKNLNDTPDLWEPVTDGLLYMGSDMMIVALWDCLRINIDDSQTIISDPVQKRKLKISVAKWKVRK